MTKSGRTSARRKATPSRDPLRERLIEARSRRLAERASDGLDDFLIGERHLICEVGETLYAVPLAEVARTTPLTRLGAIPASSDPSLIGLAADQGRVVQVFDLGARLTGREPSRAAEGYLVVLRRGRVAARTLTRPQATLAAPAEDAEHLRLETAPDDSLHGRLATPLSLDLLFSPSPGAQPERAQS